MNRRALVRRIPYLGSVVNAARCKGCRKIIVWIVTKSGKRTPVEPCGAPHFATCPEEKKFRRGEQQELF